LSLVGKVQLKALRKKSNIQKLTEQLST